MTGLIERVKRVELLKQTESEAAYQRLVRDSWDGADIDPAEALEVLTAAGRDSADLEEACKRLDDKAECQKLVAEMPELQAAMDRNKASLEAARGKLQAAEADFTAMAKRLEADNARLISRHAVCVKAADRLRSEAGMRDEENWAERQQVSKQLAAISEPFQRADQAARPEQMKADRYREERELREELHRAQRSPGSASRDASTIQAELDGLDAKYAARVEYRDRLLRERAALTAKESELEAAAIAD